MSEYWVPTVKSQSQKYVPDYSSKTEKEQDNDSIKYTDIQKSEKQSYSQTQTQKSRNQEKQSEKSPNPTEYNYSEKFSKQTEQKPSSKRTYKSSQQNSNQFKDQFNESERPSTAQSNTSYASKVSQIQNAGQRDLLTWDIKETTHKPRNPKEKYTKKQFLNQIPSQRDQNDKYFSNTRVDTCAKVVVKDGVAKAIPSYKKPPQNSFQKSAQMNNTVSFNQEQYQIKPVSSCGDRKKPLTPYNPNAPRNMLPQPKQKIPYRNDSQIQLGSQEKDKKHFLTQKQNMQGNKNTKHFDNPNPGINAYRTTWYKKQEQK